MENCWIAWFFQKFNTKPIFIILGDMVLSNFKFNGQHFFSKEMSSLGLTIALNFQLIYGLLLS